MTEFFCIHFPKKNVKLETRCVIAVWYNKQLPRLVSFFIIKLSIVIFQAIGTKKLGIDICLIASKYCKCEWIRGPRVSQDTRTLSAFTVHKIFSVGAHSPTIDYFRSCGFLSWLWTVLLPLKSIVDNYTSYQRMVQLIFGSIRGQRTARSHEEKGLQYYNCN